MANAPKRQQVGKEKKRDESQQVNEKKKPREVDLNESLGAEMAWTSAKAMTSVGPRDATTTA